jgi:hypothetical protein
MALLPALVEAKAYDDPDGSPWEESGVVGPLGTVATPRTIGAAPDPHKTDLAPDRTPLEERIPLARVTTNLPIQGAACPGPGAPPRIISSDRSAVLDPHRIRDTMGGLSWRHKSTSSTRR